MSYFLVKHLHVIAALLSITFFTVRAWWSVRESPWLQRPWVRVAPHVIDTALLGLGVWLMVLLQAWPWRAPWLAAKLLGLLLYILVGTIAIKRGKTPRTRGLAAIVAIVIFVYIIGAAVRHAPWSWLA